jgi:CHAD domain-containing protein
MARPGVSVIERIDGAAEAGRRARHDPRDADALHRFRVNLRRVVVSAKLLENPNGIPAKLRKRLRRALRETGAWRDGHVSALWLSDYAGRTRSQGGGAAALAKSLSRSAASAPAEPGWWRKIDRTLEKMRRAVEARSPKKPELRAAERAAAEKEWRRLTRRLRRLHRSCGPPALHSARIAVRRLRYLLEAMGTVPRGLPEPSALRGLQGALGEVHDRDVIAAAIAAAGRAPELRSRARRALRQLKREKSARLSCARRYWKSLLNG